MMIKRGTKRILILLICSMAAAAQAEDKVKVFAAASLTNALTDISRQYTQEKTTKIAHSFAASSTLAKQIENGAPADIFISADTKWMTYLQEKSRINVASKQVFLGNKLVLIAPNGRGFKVALDKSFDFAKSFDGRLCTGDIDSVPAGIYAKQALNYLNWWDAIKTRIVGTQDVRGALAFVERGECAAGIVYETDAKVSNKVEVVAVFPEQSHLPIVYPMALVLRAQQINADNASAEYFNYLQSAPALAIFKKYGFGVVSKSQ